MLTNLRDSFVGQSMSPNIVPFHILCTVSYCTIVITYFTRTLFTAFDFQKCHDLANRCQRSVNVIESDNIRQIAYCFLLVFFSKFVPEMHDLSDIRLQQ